MRVRLLQLLACSCAVLGVAAPARAQILPFEHYSIKEGLASNWVTSIIQDSRGYIWVAGDEGLSVYDGVRFKNYGVANGLPVSHVWCVYEGPRTPGTIWFSANNSNVWKLVDEKFFAIKSAGPPKSAGCFLEDREGTLWCGTTHGVYQVHNDSLVFFPTGTDTTWTPVIIQTREGAILMGMGTKLYRYSPQTRQTTLVPLPRPIGFTSALEDRDGNIWLGDNDGFLHQWRDDRIVTSGQVNFREVHEARALHALADDGEGNIWIATSDGIIAIAKQDFPQSSVIHYRTENGLGNADMNASICDREGNLWFGTRANGLVRLSDRRTFRFPLAGLRPDMMNHAAVSDSRGRLFVSTENGVYEIWRKSSGNWSTYLHELDHGELSGRYWQTFLDRDSTFWVSFVYGGLAGYRIKPRGEEHSQLQRKYLLRPGRELPGGFPIAYFIDERRQLWCSLRDSGGVAQYDLNTHKRRAFYQARAGVQPGTIRAILRDAESRMWIGEFQNNLALFDVVNDSLHFARRLTTAEGLPDRHIRHLMQRRNGEVWIATRFGGVGISNRGELDTLSTRQGLLSDAVWGIAEDDSGRMWLATSVGIQRTRTADSRELVTIPALRGQYFGSVGITAGNLVWGVSYLEVVIYDFSRTAEEVAPLVYLTDFYVKGEKRPFTGTAKYAYDENSCAINFIGLSFKNEKTVRYRYRLRGFDEDWQGPITEQTARFAALPAGTYTFEVVALNAEGLASAPATFTFTILPPLWQRWWFIAFCLILLSGILYAVHIMRLDRVVEIEKIRARIATDLHDDIGAGLTHIGLLSQVALQKQSAARSEDSTELRAAMTRVGNIARELSTAMSDVVWSVNPQHDSMNALQRRLRMFAQEVCEARGIQLQLEVAPALATVKLHPEIRRDLLLIAKEALHNVVKYSNSPSFSVKFALEQKNILMEISDAGTGFDVTQAKHGNGLSNMRTRAKKLGGTLEIVSHTGAGTRITVTAPLKN